MNGFEQALKQVQKGAKWRVSLLDKFVRVNNRIVPTRAEFVIDEGSESPIDKIEELFHAYYHSVPSEQSEARHQRYLNALPYEELTDEDLMYGQPRDVAQFILEYTIVCLTTSGTLLWSDFSCQNHWFWQSEKYPQLVILREWIE